MTEGEEEGGTSGWREGWRGRTWEEERKNVVRGKVVERVKGKERSGGREKKEVRRRE